MASRVSSRKRHRKVDNGVLNGEEMSINGEIVKNRYNAPMSEYAARAVYATTLLRLKKYVTRPAQKSRIAR